MVQVHLCVSQVDHGLNVIRLVGQFGLKLASRLRVMPLAPQKVAQTEDSLRRRMHPDQREPRIDDEKLLVGATYSVEIAVCCEFGRL
jgi:hypothetical protein